MMLSLTTFADELEREKARQRTTDAMVRKARAGHVTGGRVFGNDNVEILGADDERSHVERRINAAEAAVVGRVFELCAAGKLTELKRHLLDPGILEDGMSDEHSVHSQRQRRGFDRNPASVAVRAFGPVAATSSARLRSA